MLLLQLAASYDIPEAAYAPAVIRRVFTTPFRIRDPERQVLLVQSDKPSYECLESSSQHHGCFHIHNNTFPFLFTEALPDLHSDDLGRLVVVSNLLSVRRLGLFGALLPLSSLRGSAMRPDREASRKAARPLLYEEAMTPAKEGCKSVRSRNRSLPRVITGRQHATD